MKSVHELQHLSRFAVAGRIGAAVLALGAGSALLAGSRADVRFTSRIAKDTTLVRTFEQEADLALTEVKMVIDGEEMEVPEIPDYELHDEEKLEVTDRVLEEGEERPAALERTYDTIHGERLESEGEATERSSKLEGLKVHFQWNAEEERYELSLAGEEGGDEGLLSRLEEDLDLRGLLPEKEVAEGDTWKVEPKLFNRLFTPGGVHMLQADEEKDENEELDRALEANADGECTATFKGESEQDGRRVGVIAFEAKLSSQGEQEDALEADSEMGSSKTRVAVEYELEGELSWDLAGGHMASLEASGTATVHFTKLITSSEGTHDMAQTMVFTGKVGYVAKVERK